MNKTETIEPQNSHIKKERSWADLTVKNLAFWVVLALIGGVVFGNILFKKDEIPKQVLNSVELVQKNANSQGVDNSYVFQINRLIEDKNITQEELSKLSEIAATSNLTIYQNLLNLNSAIQKRDELLKSSSLLRDKGKKISLDEQKLLDSMIEEKNSLRAEITDLRKVIKSGYLTDEEQEILNLRMQNDKFTQDFALINSGVQTAPEIQNSVNTTYTSSLATFDKVNEIKSWAQVGINKFIALLKILVGPIIFVTIILGIIGLESLKKLGSIGFKAFIYFEIVSTFALAIGICFANFFGPGRGMDVDPAKLDASKVQGFVEQAVESEGKSPVLEILKGAIPTDPITPFIHGKTLQVLVMALFLAIVISVFVKNRDRIIKPFEFVQHYLFKLLLVVMWLSPIATFCAMTFLIAEFGIQSLINMGGLLLVMLGACLTFIFVVLGSILAYFKISIFKFMRYIYKEVLIVFATSSSESALAPLMKKLEDAGINKSVTGLVIPTGYSFNLDCTNIYLSLSVIFLAQAVGVELTIWHELSIIFVLMVTSKGAVGVTGSGFIVLAATLGAMPHTGIPVVAVTILLGIDKFMSEMRAVGNLCGNSVACVVVALWDKQVDIKKFKYTLDNPDSVKGLI